MHETRPILGVVHTPCLGSTHWAVKGRGAFRRLHNSQTKSSGESTPPDEQIHAASFRESDEGLTIMGSSSHSTPETDQFISKYRSPKFAAMGSSLKFLKVAEGEAHIYPRMGPTSEWDTAAAQVWKLLMLAVTTWPESHASLCAEHWVNATGVKNVSDALQIVVEAAGGEVLQWPSLEPLSYRKENILNPFFVVFGSRLPGNA